MTRICMSLLLVLAPAVALAAQFSPMKEPVAPDGTKLIGDIPASQHIRNTVGSDNLGLCVFSSIEVVARWQNIPELTGFQKWMTRRPGGGWPQKVDQTIAAFCREKSVDVPQYIQHTGGDDSFLDVALKTDRMVCVTYAGSDDFYRSGIDHMVVLAHIDQTIAAICDNNRPSVWVVMSRKDFLIRWRARGGGWAIVFLKSPPPPHLPTQFVTKTGCVCGDDCKCSSGTCPNKCPTFTQCPGGRCPLPAPAIRPVAPSEVKDYSDSHYWGQFPDGVWGWRLKGKPADKALPKLKEPEPVIEEMVENYGVVSEKIHSGERYTLPNGREVNKGQAHAILAAGDGLVDDTNRWHLTVVGDSAFQSIVKGHLDKLTVEQKAKLHIQMYQPDHWAVSLFNLSNGVSLRKPSPQRVSEEVGVVPVKDFTLDQLLNLLSLLDGKPKPAPDDSKKPDQKDDEKPKPEPVKPNWLLLIALAAGAIYLLTRKK